MILVDSPLGGGFTIPPVADDLRKLFTIGEFSTVVGLTVKSLRFYHEEGLLAPAAVDPRTGYRYYDAGQIETARAIAYLRGMEFPLAEIREMLRREDDEDDDDDDERVLEAMRRHQAEIERRMRALRKVARSLDQYIAQERQAADMSKTSYEVAEKQLEPLLIAAVRMRGRYSDCGKGCGRIGRSLGRYLCGKAMMLHHDGEYKEDDADFEAAMPVRRPKSVPDGIDVRQLPGGRCVALLHKGPYDQLGRSYAKVLQYVKDRGYQVEMPTREVYVKGPGMIFKGNPKNYLTEIQFLVTGGRGTTAAS